MKKFAWLIAVVTLLCSLAVLSSCGSDIVTDTETTTKQDTLETNTKNPLDTGKPVKPSKPSETSKAPQTTDPVVELTPSEGLMFAYNEALDAYFVSGIGSCKDRDLVIPSEHLGKDVLGVWFNAFLDCNALRSVFLPDGMISIGEGAFNNCRNLTSITIPDSVTSIGSGAFAGSAYYNNQENWKSDILMIGNHLIRVKNNIESCTIPDGVVTLADFSFMNCHDLTSVTIPSSVRSIGEFAFSQCTKLSSVTIPNGVTSLGEEAFSGCAELTYVTMPNSIKSIGMRAFYDCVKLTRIIIPNSVTSVEASVFVGCTRLMAVFCEAEKQPDTWNEWWSGVSQDIIHWGGTWAYVGGVPTVTNPIVPVKPSTDTADDSGKITVTPSDVKTGLLLQIDATNKYDTTVNKLFTGTISSPSVENGFTRISTKFRSIDHGHFLRTEALDALEAMIQAFDNVAGTDKPFRVEGYTASMAEVLDSAYVTGNVFKLRTVSAEGVYALNYYSKRVYLNGTPVTYDKWFEANAATYGFIYEGLVGAENLKAGQFRYVGTIHAAGIAKEGSLSAYIAGIKEGNIRSVTVGDETWNLSYVRVTADTEIVVGANATYTISGDNSEGVIVAVKAAQ